MPHLADEDLQRGGSRTQNRLVVVVLGAVAVALVLVAFLGPWWVMNGLPIAIWTYGPFNWTCTSSYGSCGAAWEHETFIGNYSGFPLYGLVFLVGTTLAASGLVPGVAMVALAVGSRSRPPLRRWATALGVLPFILVLAAPLEVMLFLPAAVKSYGLGSPGAAAITSGFWGSVPEWGHSGTGPLTWGPGLAWYALVAAAVLFLIGGIVLFHVRIPSPMQATPQTSQGPPE